MRVAYALLGLLSLLSVAPLPTLGLGADLLKFELVTSAAQFPGRRQAFVRQLTGTVSFTSATGRPSYTNPLALMGGFVPDWSDDFNDVWLSSDRGRTWAIAAGVTVDGESNNAASAQTSWPTTKNNGASFALMPTTGAIVRVSQEVYTSSNVQRWTEVAQGSYPYEQRNIPTLVATSRGVLIRASGQDADGAFRNDVLTSTDGGKNWRVATEQARWSARFVPTMLTMPSSIDGGKDITYIMAGRDTADNYNDVWASSDDGKTWVAVSGAGPFMPRGSANGAVTKDGLLILAGGYADDAVGAFNIDVANDV